MIPRAGRTAIAGWREAPAPGDVSAASPKRDALLVRLAAAPVEGAANDALIDLLSKTLGVPRRHITIASGQRSRDKRVDIKGLDDAQVAARLSDILRT